jgi:urease accessory protein
MLIQQKQGNIHTDAVQQKTIDWLSLHWYELNKRIMRKKTAGGKELSLRFLQENPALTQGDILLEDEQTIIAVDVLPCDCMAILPATIFEAASICYEIGNKHLPLFYESDTLLIPFETPLFAWLTAQGYAVTKEQRKLLQPLKTTVAPHGGGTTLLSKILKLTTHE